MALSQGQLIFLCAIGILLLAKPAHAFGAGNIGSTSKIEGQNWRHGDLEDTLLTIVASKAMGGKKFTKLDVKRVYFGNWLRDYSQAVDVGTVKYVSAEAIRILLWVLGFLSFGYGSKEFEVTTDRLGCYRPEEHIDNPKDYAENEDARQYDRRLRGPVDERRELAINPETGLKNYIASENMGIDTSAGLVRNLFGRSIQLGRQYARNKNKADLYEALRLLGTGCHCLEDFSAHSNYIELALIEMGERDVFPHVGRRTGIQIRGARNEVYPVVTGTFGGVDFLHSVCGEFDDKVTQSEVEELEGTLQQAQNSNQDSSVLQDLLNKVPSGIFGDKDEAGKAEELKQNAQAHRMQNTRISPRQPEEWTRYINDVQKQICPIIEWHDEVMQSITETIEKIPILPDLIDNIQDEINKFVFSLLAPYVVPIIHQIKNELNTGSSEIIESSKNAQHIVFNDDRSSDPTHSMLSKDHFSNILNEPAGKVASQTVKWAVPQLIAAWDDERVDVNRTCDRIIHGVMHHPAQRDSGQDGASDGRRLMFQVVEKWWRSKDEREKNEFRENLSRRGVESGRNHKEGVKDHGHGSNKPLGMANLHQKESNYPAAQAVGAVENLVDEITGSGGGQGMPNRQSGQYGGGRQQDTIGKTASEAVGGGLLGSLVGGVASAVGKDMLGGGLDEDKKTYKRESYGRDGSRTETCTQVGHSSGGDRYGQAQYSRTEEPYGGRSEQYTRYEQRETRGSGYQAEVRREERDTQGRYHEETRTYGSGTVGYGPSTASYGESHETSSYSRGEETTSSYTSGGYGSQQQQRRRDSNDSDDYKKKSKHGKKDSDDDDDDYKKKSKYGKKDSDDDDDDCKKKSKSKYGRKSDDDDSDDDDKKKKRSSGYGGGSGYGQQQSSYGGGREEREGYGSGGGYGRQEQTYGGGGGGYGRQEQSSYGRQDQSYGGGGGYESQQSGGYGGRDDKEGYGGGGGYGRQQQSYDSSGGYGRQEESYSSGGGYGARQEESYGGGYGSGGGGYGSQQGYGRGDDEGGYGGGGGYGGRDDDDNQGYGGRRRDDDDGEYSRY